KAYYGSPRFSRALWWANRGVIAWPGALAEGKQIVIPPVDALNPKLLSPQSSAAASASLPTLERIVRVASQPPGDRRQSPRVDPEVKPASASKTKDEAAPAEGFA